MNLKYCKVNLSVSILTYNPGMWLKPVLQVFLCVLFEGMYTIRNTSGY